MAGRPAISEAIRVRRAIAALNDDDFEDIVRDIDVIAEAREAEKKRRVKGVTNEPQTGNGESAESTTAD